jgi:hypothetical protein
MRGISRIGFTLRLNAQELNTFRAACPKGKSEKDFVKYCALVGLNQLYENAKKKLAEKEGAANAQGNQDDSKTDSQSELQSSTDSTTQG